MEFTPFVFELKKMLIWDRMGQGSDCAAFFVSQVLEKDYDLIMMDARGHGLSDTPEMGYTPADRAADLAGFIQALGLEKP